MVISLEDVSFSYRKGKKVFEDVHPGKAWGRPLHWLVLREEKTTLLKILLGQLKHQKEDLAFIPNEKHKTLARRQGKTSFSHVPQDNMLFSGTIADNLRLAKPDATEEEIKEVLVWQMRMICIKPADGINQMLRKEERIFRKDR